MGNIFVNERLKIEYNFYSVRGTIERYKKAFADSSNSGLSVAEANVQVITCFFFLRNKKVKNTDEQLNMNFFFTVLPARSIEAEETDPGDSKLEQVRFRKTQKKSNFCMNLQC